MAPSLGGFDVLNLYSEAIGKMTENPGIPALFRDIFKNAYLPYRDPETLRSFLKEIDAFTYDHSERWATPSNTCSRCSAARATPASSARRATSSTSWSRSSTRRSTKAFSTRPAARRAS
jgi:hypothetical protein